MRKNVASQIIGAQMITAADGTAFTGSVSVAVTVDGGTQGAGGGTGPTHEGNGFHSYIPTQAETNGDHVAFTFTGTGAIPATVQVYTQFPQTGDNFARLGAPAGASVSADIAAVKSDSAAILTDTGTTLETHLTDIKGATFSGATDSLEAIRNRGDAAWTTGAGGTPPQLLQSTTIATLASQTSFTLTAGSADNDAYNGAIAVITDSATSTQKAVGTISDYVGASKTVTLSADPAIFTMAVGDTIEIIAALGTGATAAAIRAEIDSNSTQLAAIVADTNELQTDWADGGRLDLIQDAILVDTAEIGVAGAGLTNINLPNQTMDITGNITGNLSGSVGSVTGAVGSVTGAVGSVTGTVGGIAGTITTLDALDTAQDTQHSTTQGKVDTAQADLDILTGIDGVTLATSQANYAPATAASVAALNDISAADVWAAATRTLTANTNLNDITVANILTTAMTESYAVNGAAPTLAQAIFAIHQALMQFSIAGTSNTVKKLDNSTTAFVVTLDDATSPTGASRV